LRSVDDQSWQCLITLDESKFYLAPDHKQIWLRPDQARPESAKRTVHDKIIIMSIAWNPLGFHFVKALPNKRIDNADYDRADIFTARIQFLSEAGGRKFNLHADNARHHPGHICRTLCAENGLRLATHLTHSPGLAPLDFFLLGDAKECRQGNVFPSSEELIIVIELTVRAVLS
jgi:hypothetical protein